MPFTPEQLQAIKQRRGLDTPSVTPESISQPISTPQSTPSMDTPTQGGMPVEEKAMLLDLELPKKKESFASQFGKNLLEAPKAFGRGLEKTHDVLFGGAKKVAEGVTTGMLDGGLAIPTGRGADDKIQVLGGRREQAVKEMERVVGQAVNDPNVPQETKNEIIEQNIQTIEDMYKDDPTALQVVGGAVEVFIDLATAGIGTGSKELIKQGAKQASKSGGLRGAWNYIKGSGTIKGAATGAGFGLAGTAQQEDPTSGDFVKSATIGAVTGGILGKLSQGTRPEKVQAIKDDADMAVRNILQVKKKDIKKAAKGLDDLDLSEAKTYEDIVNVAREKHAGIFNSQDEYLKGIDGVITPKEATKAIGKRKVDYVKEALEDMQSIYEKEGAIDEAAKIDDFIERYNKGGLSFQDVNLVAKEYGGKFKDTTFTKLGEQKSSLTAARHENIRKGVKTTFRDLLPDDTSKVLDEKASNLYDTLKGLEKVENQIFSLEQRVAKRGLAERLGKRFGQALDIVTFGFTGGLMRSFVQSNAGNKTLNSLALQEVIQNNVKLIEKAKNAKTDKAFIDTIGQILQSVPKVLRSQALKADVQATAETTQE